MSIAQPQKNSNVRQSTDSDMAAIRAWLEKQDRDEVHGTFLCNWSLTQRAHDKGELLVYIDPQTQEPLGYQWGRLVRPGILEVRNDCQGRGIGRALVEHCLALALESDNDILRIECKPSSSIPFWQAMGFQLKPKQLHEHKNEAFRILSRVHDHPDGDGGAKVTVEWFSEERKRSNEVPPVAAHTVDGVWFGDELELTERVSFFSGLATGDPVVRVVVDGREWYCEKAKYEQAEYVGVESCTNGFRVDTLYRPR